MQTDNHAPRTEPVRFTATRRQRLVPAALLLIPNGYPAVHAWTNPMTAPHLLALNIAATVINCAAVALVLSWPPRVELTTEAIVMRQGLRRRRKIAWRDVQGLQIESSGSRRKLAVYTADGRRAKLPTPFTGPVLLDRRFTEKYHAIGQVWLARRGADWAPVQDLHASIEPVQPWPELSSP